MQRYDEKRTTSIEKCCTSVEKCFNPHHSTDEYPVLICRFRIIIIYLHIFLTELSEVKREVKAEVDSLCSWKLKWTIPYHQHHKRPARSA